MIRIGTRGSKYSAGLISGYVATILTIIIGLWITPFTLKFLNRDEYAIFTIASDFLMWLGLLDLGLSAGLNSQVAQLVGKNDENRLSIVASSAFFAQTGISILVVSLGVVFSTFFVNFFKISPELVADAKLVFIILSISSGLTILTQSFSAVLIANQQIYVDNSIRIILLFVRTGITVFFLVGGFRILSLAYANLIAVIITSFLYLLRTKHTLPSLNINWRYFSPKSLRSTYDVGIWFFLGGIAGLLIVQFDRIVTARLLSLELVTIMSLTGRIYTLSNTFIQQITNTMRPVFGQNFGMGKLSENNVLYHQTVKLSTGLAVLVSFSIFAGNERFISWWVGSSNYGGWHLDLALAVNLIVGCLVLPNRAILAASMKYLPQHNIARLVEGFVNLGLSLWFGSLLGVEGVILGTIVAAIIVSIWFLPWLTSKLFKERYFNYFRFWDIRLWGFGAILLSLSFLFRKFNVVIRNDFLAFGSSFSLLFVIGFLFLWFFIFDKKLKEKIIVVLSTFPPLAKIFRTN